MDNKGQALSPSFVRSLLAHCDQHLEHAEPRVRSLVASTLGALTRAGDESSSGCTGLAAYEFFRKRLSGAISKNFERTKETITDVISGAENVAVDDTSGWKALETSFLALKVGLPPFLPLFLVGPLVSSRRCDTCHRCIAVTVAIVGQASCFEMFF